MHFDREALRHDRQINDHGQQNDDLSLLGQKLSACTCWELCVAIMKSYAAKLLGGSEDVPCWSFVMWFCVPGHSRKKVPR